MLLTFIITIVLYDLAFIPVEKLGNSKSSNFKSVLVLWKPHFNRLNLTIVLVRLLRQESDSIFLDTFRFIGSNPSLTIQKVMTVKNVGVCPSCHQNRATNLLNNELSIRDIF